MGEAALETALRRDRALTLAALLLVAALAWAYLFWLAQQIQAPPDPMAGMDMAGMDMPGMNMSAMDMVGMAAPAIRPWSAAQFTLMFVMWAVMMTGMMLPSAAPMILLYARVGRHAAAQQKPFTATGWFALGYILAWAAFSLGATAAQSLLAGLALLSPMMKSTNAWLGGGVLIAAGIWQWTPLKQSCLANCRSPLDFIQRHGGFKAGAKNAVTLGLRHGLYCVGCCWALMLLLFVGGIMNLLWIAALAILVLGEKLLPQGKLLSRTAGLVMIAAGLVLILRP
jgi:predicted metal-binding membrane protein